MKLDKIKFDIYNISYKGVKYHLWQSSGSDGSYNEFLITWGTLLYEGEKLDYYD